MPSESGASGTIEVTIQVCGPVGVERWAMEVHDRESDCLVLRSIRGQTWVGSGWDLWSALRDIRRQVELLGYLVCCNGCRINAHASRMSIDMARGARVYLLRMGKPARRRHLVDLLGPAPCSDVATVAEQDEFYDRWLDSLHAREKPTQQIE